VCRDNSSKNILEKEKWRNKLAQSKLDKRSEEAKQWRKLYGTALWIKGRAWFLRQHPLCVFCEEEGIAEPATILDHKIPHKGDKALFYDQANWQGLCKIHHDSMKQIMEKNAHLPQVDPLTGWPVEN
jgi:5-methylcytosine-specific restriction protein A